MEIMVMRYFLLILSCCLLPCIVFADGGGGDFGDTSSTATEINADGTRYFADLTAGDEDWMYFTKGANERYRFTFINGNWNWKYIRIYQMNDEGELVEQKYMGAYYNINGSITKLFFETSLDCYVKVYGSEGSYSIQIDYIDTTPPDSYSSSCASPTVMTVGAAPIVGTLDHSDPLNFDQDWFVFPTQTLHKYEINLTRADNSDSSFEVWSDVCENLNSSGTNKTFVSWFGDDFKLFVNGWDGGIGHRYEIQVIDHGLQPDEYGNIAEDAYSFTPSSDEVAGVIDYNTDMYSDEDWLVFTPQAMSNYRISLNNQDYNWKYMRVYQENLAGDLVEIYYGSVYNGDPSVVVFLEWARKIYIKVYGATGRYGVTAEYMETIAPDSYGNDCSSATMIAVDTPVDGVITHSGSSLEDDWFEFQTQPLHKYHITISKNVNSNAWFQTYNASCGDPIYGAVDDLTMTSWYGNNFKLQVSGSSGDVGHHYTILVEDVGTYTDDWPNTADPASAIGTNAKWAAGEINYISTMYSDEDWIGFTADLAGDYNVSINNPQYDWKYVRLYGYNDVHQLVEIGYTSAYNGIGTLTRTLAAGQYYIKVYGSVEGGKYFINVAAPGYCGSEENPYPRGDVNMDCVVDIDDLLQIADDWLAAANVGGGV